MRDEYRKYLCIGGVVVCSVFFCALLVDLVEGEEVIDLYVVDEIKEYSGDEWYILKNCDTGKVGLCPVMYGKGAEPGDVIEICITYSLKGTKSSLTVIKM